MYHRAILLRTKAMASSHGHMIREGRQMCANNEFAVRLRSTDPWGIPPSSETTGHLLQIDDSLSGKNKQQLTISIRGSTAITGQAHAGTSSRRGASEQFVRVNGTVGSGKTALACVFISRL